MSEQATPPTRPWAIEVIPDMFGYHLYVQGQRFYIAKEYFDSVLVAMAMVKERESAGYDWIADLTSAIRGERGELLGAPVQDE